MKKPLQIAITGGKGGTGKSTFAIYLAAQYFKKGKKIILVDCDVECPNQYLLLNQKLKHPVKKIFALFPKLNKNKCKKCGLCQKVCRNHAIFQTKNKYPLFIQELCSACGTCQAVCPYQAISSVKTNTGNIFVNQIKKNFWLITGLANPGLEETGPIVQQLKKFVSAFSQKKETEIILFDTAAGTHCPVITALLGCDLIYAITEPTPMGVTDLKLILELSQKLKIPKTNIIINQANLGKTAKIKTLSKQFHSPIYQKIPYSKEIVKNYSKSELFNYFLKNVE